MNEKYRIKSISNFYIIEFKTREWFGLLANIFGSHLKKLLDFI